MSEMRKDEKTSLASDAAYMENTHLLPSGLLIPHYLIHSCLYYRFGTSIISDKAFDYLARRIYDEWETLEHQNKNLIDREGLKSGGSYIVFTRRIECVAKMFYQLKHPEDMPINARSKGQRGEREIIDLLQPHIDEVANYAGVTPPLLQRNTLQSDRGGFDIVGLPGFALEVKRVENDIPSAVQGWWEQAVRQAVPNLEPVLLWRVNGGKWRVRVFARLDLPGGKRYKIPADIKFEHFVFWMKSRLFGHLTEAKKSVDGTIGPQ